MSLKKKIVLALLVVILVLLNVAIFHHHGDLTGNVELHMLISGTKKTEVQDYYSPTKAVIGTQTGLDQLTKKNKEMELKFTQTSDTKYTRIDLGVLKAKFTISKMWYEYNGKTQEVDLSAFTEENAVDLNDITSSKIEDGKLVVETKADDPYIIAKAGPTSFVAEIAHRKQTALTIRKVIYALLLDLFAVAIVVLWKKKFSTLPQELWQNRRLILQLARNDFKMKFAGSVLGTFWAFVQPVVTVLVYWFVFGHLGSGNVTASTGVSYPFVLWLIAGLVPWFFFQDALIGGTNSLIEYSYLVKKVVFKISILPIVKQISALYVHIFFIGVMLVLYAAAGHFPDIYMLQVLYYSFAMFIYTLGVCYATSAIVIFFRDLSQIINIILQVQIWMTPIMWNIDTIGPSLPGWALTILKLNPMYYIAMGYRDAMMNKMWFWQRFDQTVYFWLITVVFFGLGTFLFNRLKVHFADIL